MESLPATILIERKEYIATNNVAFSNRQARLASSRAAFCVIVVALPLPTQLWSS
jgi:hypothetical protein